MLRYDKSNRMNLKYFLTFLPLLLITPKLSAENLKGAPAINSQNGKKMPYEFEQSQQQKSSKRVRIPLKMTPYKKVVLQSQTGKARTKHVPSHLILQTLRSRVDRPNHFYVQDFHLETHPQKFNSTTKQYEVRVVINRVFGANNQLEEQIGYIDLTGQLAGGPEIYNFLATGGKKFSDKEGNPILDFRIEWPQEPRQENAPAVSNINPVSNQSPVAKQNEEKKVKPTPTDKG